MPERVLLEAVKQPGKIVRLGPRLAAHLVRSGAYRYITRDETPEVTGDEGIETPKPRKKRAYKRRDLKAEE